MESLKKILKEYGFGDERAPERLAAIYSISEAAQNGERLEIELGADWDAATKSLFFDAVTIWAFANGCECWRSYRTDSRTPRVFVDFKKRVAYVEGTF